MGCRRSEESHFKATGRVLPADGMASQFWTLVLCCVDSSLDELNLILTVSSYHEALILGFCLCWSHKALVDVTSFPQVPGPGISVGA